MDPLKSEKLSTISRLNNFFCPNVQIGLLFRNEYLRLEVDVRNLEKRGLLDEISAFPLKPSFVIDGEDFIHLLWKLRNPETGEAANGEYRQQIRSKLEKRKGLIGELSSPASEYELKDLEAAFLRADFLQKRLSPAEESEGVSPPAPAALPGGTGEGQKGKQEGNEEGPGGEDQEAGPDREDPPQQEKPTVPGSELTDAPTSRSRESQDLLPEKSHGWVKFHRDQLDHWVSEDKPWCAGYAWAYLYAQANHRAGNAGFRGEYIPLERGQFITSKCRLRAVFLWGKIRLENFLKRLISDNMIAVKSTNRFMIITILNYERYQGRIESNQPTERPTDQPTEKEPARNG
jgi:hypothetical protein